MSRVDNAKLGGAAPSVYRSEMPTDVKAILQHALCPPSIFHDDFGAFIDERAAVLAEEANKLI